ncbi:MAG: metallophosphoesterase [Acidobacteria bacterium]|nr:metallophosphoesterase [Acidobacteriota bacterium]
MSLVVLDAQAALEEKLARRREVEQAMRSGLRRPGHRGSFIFRFDEQLKPLIRLALQWCGMYERGLANARSPIVRQIRFEYPGLPRALDGFRILHLADPHIDGVDGLAENLAAMIGQLDYDVCVMTGDYRFAVHGPATEAMSRMERVLGAVRSRHPVFGILGNHDDADIGIALHRLGVRMLVNAGEAIEHGGARLWIGGVDDPHTFECHDLDGALEDSGEADFRLLLAHSPEIYDEAAAAAVHLYLCGHTHAGQVRFPLIGALAQNAECPYAYRAGQWRHEEMYGYTSAGAGCSMLPVRFNCPAEVAVIELTRG